MASLRRRASVCLWAWVLCNNRSHGFGLQQQHRRHVRQSTTHLHVVRRPLRPASTEKKRAERKAIIESRQNDALQDPSLLTKQTFAECQQLNPSSKRALVEDMGLSSMTEVQARTFVAAIEGKDILARARTGTGKTLAFLIPIVERILQNPTFLHGKDVSCLVIAPTRELAIQIGDEAETLLSHLDLSVQVMYGGTKMARDINAMNKRLPAIMVATPGRLMDHLQGTKVRGRKFSDDIISNLDIVVLDEVDRLVDMGMRTEIQKIMSYLPRKDKRQTMLFSATVPTQLRKIMKDSMKDDFVEVDCVKDGAQSAPTNLRVTQSHVILPSMSNVLSSVYSILKEATTSRPYKIVVFFPTARMVSFFADFLNDGLEYPVVELHSKKSQSSRNTASSNFRQAKNAILFTSDLSARGVDYPDVTQVIQVGMPESREQYIHRLGRTARAGKEGSGLLVLFPFESRFLSEIRGLHVASNHELSSSLSELAEEACPEWMQQNYSKVNSGGNKLANSAQLAYLSFLGYYLGQVRRIQDGTKNDVASLSAEFSQAIGLANVPSIPRKLITKMELEGIPGVVSEDD
eukprot:scaffold5184_cov155-Skeletonema_marinoi.AAC.2